MNSLNTLHSQLDEALNINSVDTVFTPLYYTDLINGQREVWLRNEYNKNRSIDPNIQQVLPCVEVELVDPHTCCIEVPVGCKLLRTKHVIPNTIEFYNNKGITSIGPVDITQKRFVLIDYNRVPYVGNSRFNKTTIFAFLYEGYIYLISNSPINKLVQYITIRGIFTDPTSLGDVIDCQGNTCWSPYDPYPLNGWMWEQFIKPYIIQQLMQKQMIPLDNENDAKDNKTDGATG
jgi:hypothetical protein